MSLATIPAGQNFLQVLADYLHQDSRTTQTDLSDYQILLPTRRAVRSLQQLLMAPLGKPSLLPRIHAIGDVDDDALMLASPDIDLPPVMPTMERLGRLVQIIRAQSDMPWGRALTLAEALMTLLDEATLREVPLSQLETLVPEMELARHWEISLAWLRVIIQQWPEILAQHGMVDAATHRQSILHGYAAWWQKAPPSHPIIAAGSTGSLPATRALLQTIARLPRGLVILPGLDAAMPDEIWESLPLSHHQRPLWQLLHSMGAPRGDVKSMAPEPPPARLWQQVLLPAEATARWRQKDFRLINSAAEAAPYLDHLRCITAPDAETESQCIALILARAAHDGKSAALVTPHRDLATRVAAQLRRYDLNVNDSAGQNAAQSLPGRWLLALLTAWQGGWQAADTLALLKHPLSCFGMAPAACRAAARELEIQLLRRKAAAPQSLRHFHEADWQAFPWLAALRPLVTDADNAPQSMAAWLETLLALADQLTAPPEQPPAFWQGRAGDSIAAAWQSWQTADAFFPVMNLSNITDFLAAQLKAITLHAAGQHPHIHILGPLEARLHTFDVMVLGGLNEGIWPADRAADPWLSRPMRQTMKLAMPDELLALTTHDFYQLAAAPKTYLTRASYDNGAPTLPSRWWQRLMAYLKACRLPDDCLEDASIMAAVKGMDASDDFVPAQRPAPVVPSALRPKRYSPSGLVKLIQNPYQFYAERILRLDDLPALGEAADERLQGEWLHAVMKKFCDDHPDNLPHDAAEKLLHMGRETLAQYPLSATDHDFWWQNFLAASENFLAWQTATLATGRVVVGTEVPIACTWQIGGETIGIQARLDRIDRDAEGRYWVVDYKRKNNASIKDVLSLREPQLMTECLLLESGGWQKAPDAQVVNVEFWPLLGKKVVRPKEKEFAAAKSQTETRLIEFLSHYLNPETPYRAQIPKKTQDHHQPYLQLARHREWQGEAA